MGSESFYKCLQRIQTDWKMKRGWWQKAFCGFEKKKNQNNVCIAENGAIFDKKEKNFKMQAVKN